MQNKEEKLNLVKQIITDDNVSVVVSKENQVPAAGVDGKLGSSLIRGKQNVEVDDTEDDASTNFAVSVPLVNPRLRRSNSAERWLSYCPAPLFPLETVFQPHMSSRESVNQLTDPKDITDRTSKYCLLSQQDVNGELETKLYKNFRESQSRLEKNGYAEAADLELDIDLVYSLGGPFPSLEVKNAHDDQTLTTLMRFLEQRIIKQNLLSSDLQKKQTDFRNMLVSIERENVSLKIENATLKASNEEQKKKLNTLQNHVCKAETQKYTLIQKFNSTNNAIRFLQQEVRSKDLALNQRIMEKKRTKQKYNNKMQAQTQKMNKELEDCNDVKNRCSIS